MGVADRLTITSTGDGNDSVMEAPGVITRPVTDDATIDAESMFRDARGNRVVEVTTDASGADTFTLTFKLDPDETGLFAGGTVDADGAFTTGSLNDDDNAATIQAAVRSALPGTDLTVVVGDGPGPFYIVFDRAFYGRRYPRVSGTGTGCTVTVSTFTTPFTPEDLEAAAIIATLDGEIRALGESHRVSETDTILAPTIGTITVTGSTHQIDTLDYASGTAGGTFDMRTGGGGIVSSIAWNAEAATIEAALDARADSGANSQVTVAKRGTNEVQTLVLSSWDSGDTIKLTFDGHESSAVTYAATATAGFQAAIDEILLLSDDFTLYNAGDCVVTKTDVNTYVFTFSGVGVEKRNVAAITATSGTGSATGAVTETTPGIHDGYTFTHDNAIPGPSTAITLNAQALTDGSSTAKTAVFTAGSTAGVLGSISTTYTENGAGDTVLASAVNDTTGKSYGFAKDAASPVAITGLPPGTYHFVLRTVEDGRVSRAANKAFTVT